MFSMFIWKQTTAILFCWGKIKVDLWKSLFLLVCYTLKCDNFLIEREESESQIHYFYISEFQQYEEHG